MEFLVVGELWFFFQRHEENFVFINGKYIHFEFGRTSIDWIGDFCFVFNLVVVRMRWSWIYTARIRLTCFMLHNVVCLYAFVKLCNSWLIHRYDQCDTKQIGKKFTTFPYILSVIVRWSLNPILYRPTSTRICVLCVHIKTFIRNKEDTSPSNHIKPSWWCVYVLIRQALQVFKAFIESITDLWKRQFSLYRLQHYSS